MNLIPQKLDIGQERHQHAVEQIVFLQQVLVGQLQFGVLGQLLLAVHQNVLAQQLPQDGVLLLQLGQGQVDRHQRRLQTLEQGLLGEGLLGVLTDVPEQVLITELVDLLKSVGHLQLLLDLHHPLFHLLLLGLESLHRLLHLLGTRLPLLHLLFIGRIDLILLLLYFIQLAHVLLVLLLQPLHLLILRPLQLSLQLFHLLRQRRLLIPQPLPTYPPKGLPHRPSLRHPQHPKHIPALLHKRDNHSSVLHRTESLTHLTRYHTSHRTDTRTVTRVELELTPVTHLLQLADHPPEIGTFLTLGKRTQQTDSSRPLFLQSSAEVFDLALLYQQSFTFDLLETRPFREVFLPAEDPLNAHLQPLLTTDQFQGDNADTFPGLRDAVAEQPQQKKRKHG